MLADFRPRDESRRRGSSRKKVLASLVAIVVVLTLVSTYYVVLPQVYCVGSAAPISYSPSFSFNMSATSLFYLYLKTPFGLETVYPGSKTIWLADDQALDYNALLRVHNATADSMALTTANGIDVAIREWGGFYRYWNPVFETFGSYPNSTAVLQGNDITVNGSYVRYTVKATQFLPNPSFNYSSYADQVAYRVLLYLHLKKLLRRGVIIQDAERHVAGIERAGFCRFCFPGRGKPAEGNPTYQSYKLAVYVIAWKQLEATPATQRFASGYQATVESVTALMSTLQSSGGGVWSGYTFSIGHIVSGSDISQVNGETTSLFVLAKG